MAESVWLWSKIRHHFSNLLHAAKFALQLGFAMLSSCIFHKESDRTPIFCHRVDECSGRPRRFTITIG